MSINVLEHGNNYIRNNGIYPYIIQIGTGGTGGYLVQHIAQLLSISGKQASYIIVDPDIIEEKNLGNQLFLKEEVGLKKADVLASRYSSAYDIDIASYSESFIESKGHLQKLFSTEYLQTYDYRSGRKLFLPIVIGCVDNNYTRKVLHELFSMLSTCVYIDAGNESTTVPSDWLQRPKTDWTDEEVKVFNDSGWTGQVVTGFKLNKNNIQEPVADVFPDILLDNDMIRPSEVSCADLLASEPQRLIVNKFAALIITNIVTQIVEESTISSHVTFFHAKKGYMRSTDVQTEKQSP